MTSKAANDQTGTGVTQPHTAFSYRRFSSDKQEQGDSLRRQTEAAQAWCDVNGYVLSTATFEDLGVSAFKGRNVEVGALKAFLEAVETGKVPQGSTLLVESLDRLSRQHWQRGLTLLQDIVESGVNLVTLSDGKMYLANQPIDFADGIMILVGFQRAHEESATKSKRVTAAWNNNTADTIEGKRARTSTVPGWISLPKATPQGGWKHPKDCTPSDLKVIDKKAEVVREVFTRFANGERPVAIAKDLDNRGVPTLKHGRWRGQTISQLLRSEAPFGHLEIGRRMTAEEKDGVTPLPKGTYRRGHRVITDMVRGYFPRIVDEDTERRVRLLLDQREKQGLAPAKERGPVQPRGRQAKAALVGVLMADEGTRAIRKVYRNGTYVNPVTHGYIGKVDAIDQVVIDYWPEVVKAHQVETTQDTEGHEAALEDARETLEFLQSKPGTAPRLLMAAEAEVEQLEKDLKALKDSAGMGMIDLPRDVSNLEPHELNSLVRSVIKEVWPRRYNKMVRSTSKRTPNRMLEKRGFDLQVTMKNGVTLLLGEGLSGFAG